MFGKKKNTEAPPASMMGKQQSASAPSIQGQSMFASEMNPPMPQVDFGFRPSYPEPAVEQPLQPEPTGYPAQSFDEVAATMAPPSLETAPPPQTWEPLAEPAATEWQPSETPDPMPSTEEPIWETPSELSPPDFPPSEFSTSGFATAELPGAEFSETEFSTDFSSPEFATSFDEPDPVPPEPVFHPAKEPAWNAPVSSFAPEFPPQEPLPSPASEPVWEQPVAAAATAPPLEMPAAESLPVTDEWLAPPPESAAVPPTESPLPGLDNPTFAEITDFSNYAQSPRPEAPPQTTPQANTDPFATNFEPYEDTLTDTQPAETDMWNNLSAPQELDQQGQQFPATAAASGHFLDTVTEQLYPVGDEVFSTEELLATERAFAEAANFFFPETATAELEWRMPEDVVNVSATPYPSQSVPPTAQPEAAAWQPSVPAEPVSDLFFTSAAALDPIPAFDPFQSSAPESVTFMSEAATPDLTPPAFSMPSGQPVGDAPSLETPGTDRRSWDTDWDFAAEATEAKEPESPGLQFVSEPAAEEDAFPGLSLENEATLGEDAEDLDFSSSDEFSDNVEEPAIKKRGDWGDIEWGASEDINTFSLGGDEPTSDASPFAISQNQPALNTQDPSSDLFPSFSMDDLSPDVADTPAISFGLDSPSTTTETWGDWPTPAPVETTPASTTSPSTPDISQWNPEKIQVLASFPIEHDKSLLLVQYENLFALMGQTGGPENSQVSVVKTFTRNPLQDADIFGAQKEGETAGKRMYLTQVGNWQAILSADNQSILLHTELS